MTEPLFSINFTARMLASEACAATNCLVYHETDGLWRVATSANRTAARAGTQAIALTDYGGSVVGKVTYQSSGLLSSEFSGLPDIGGSTRKLVRTSTAGVLERVEAYTDGDDIVGYAFADGRVALHLGIPWSLIAATAANPALPDYSVQYRKPDGTFGGAAHVSIDPTGGYIESNTGTAGTPGNGIVATEGNFRGDVGGTDGAGFLIAVSSPTGSSINALSVRSLSGSGDSVRIGSSTPSKAPQEFRVRTNSLITFELTNAKPEGGLSAAYIVDAATVTPVVGTWGWRRSFVFARHCNLAFFGANTSINVEQLLGTGEGVAFWGDAEVVPTTNPAGGYIGYTDPATHHPMARMPNGDVFDLTEGGSGDWPPPYKFITAADIDVDGIVDTLVGGVPALTLIFDDTVSADVEIVGFTQPTSGKSGEHKLIHALNGEFTVRIANNGGGDGDDPRLVFTASGSTWVLDNSVGSYGIDYNWAEERWVPQRGAS